MKRPLSALERASSAASRRIAYSLAAGAAASAASTAEAVVVYSGIEDATVLQGKDPYKLRIDEDTKDDLLLKNYVFTGGNYQGVRLPYFPGRMVGFFAGPTNIAYATALGPGFLVDINSINPDIFAPHLAYGSHNPNAQFNNIQNAYLGFSFAKFPDPDDPGVRELHYAWARISVNNVAGTMTLHDWAYQTEVDVGIVTGDKGDAGDFNDDGKVDAADYTVWRDNLGSDHPLGGHGDENYSSFDVVDGDDYTIWKANFGHVEPSPGAGAVTGAVPEPGALGFLAAGSLGVLAWRRRRGLV